MYPYIYIYTCIHIVKLDHIHTYICLCVAVVLPGPGYTSCKQYRLVCCFTVLHVASYINSYSYAALEDLERTG